MPLLLHKEMLQLWRTFRFPALTLTALFFGLLEPLTARFMPQIITYLARELEGLAELIPPMGPVEALAGYYGDLFQIGTIVLIIIAMGTVALERERGIAAWVLTRPVKRGDYIWAKYLALAVSLAASLALGGLVAMLYTRSLLGPFSWAAALWSLFFVALFLNLILAVTVAASTFLRSQLAAGGVAIAFFFVIWVPQLLLGRLEVARFFPHALASSSPAVLAGALEPARLWPAAAIATALALALIALSVHRFGRAEL